MLGRINIKNYAVIDELAIDFEDGFSVLTGETGAGKSVLIGALGLLLGDRSDTSMIRTGAEKLIIEGEFSIKDLKIQQTLEELGIDNPEILIIRREVSVAGKNRAFINGAQETVARLEEVGRLLADMHGQHDHQLLLNKKVHIDLLDSFGNLQPERDAFKILYEEALTKIKEEQLFQANAEALKKERDYYANAYAEITNAQLQPEDEQELEEKLFRMQNSEKIFDALNRSYQSIYQAEINASLMLEDAKRSIAGIVNFSKKYEELAEILEDALEKSRESAHLLSSYLDEIDYNASDMDTTTDKISLIKELKRKYQRPTIQELNDFAEECRLLLDKADNFEEEFARLAQQKTEIIEKLKEKALRLSKMRQDTAKKIQEKIEAELHFLGMEKSKFLAHVNYVKDEDSFLLLNDHAIRVTPNGIDNIEFLISANPGEEPKPLQKTASGGEISRIMLALKSALAQNDPIEISVFDEIDAGIGGMTAHHVAVKMAEIAKTKQVFCITHLAQIAAKASYHYLISKSVQDDKTFTAIRLLDKEERVHEIARMLGASGENSEKLAREMLNEK